jgi:predicted methyltransferase
MKWLMFLLPISIFANDLIQQIYNKGKEFNYGYTLVAIAYVESRLGKYMINLQDPSCGLFHVMPSTLSHSKWKQSRICEALIKDTDFSITVALKRLKYFENYWKGRGYRGARLWRRTVNSYNSGFGNNPKYVNSIIHAINRLKPKIKDK